jgi:ankyrin repeat protein
MTGFILIDQLCLVNPVDALLHWTSPEKTNFIPSDRLPQWNSERISVLENPLKQRFFILSTFVKFGQAPQVERLLNKWNYMDQIHETSHDGQTLLIAACIAGQTDIVALLCDNGVNVNHANAVGWTALHYAASFCHLQIVENLINHSALINAKTSKEFTPLDVFNRAPPVHGKKEAKSQIQQLLRGKR